MWISGLTVGKPLSESNSGGLNDILSPAECRGRGISYKAKMQAKLNWRVNGAGIQMEVRNLGSLPIMVRSSRCHLFNKSPKELIQMHEDPDEFGGYFLCNGIERLIRLLIVPRRNFPTAIIRPSFANRGPTYSQFGVSIRSVRADETSQTLTLHYCTDGEVNLRFSYKKSEYMVPMLLILSALTETNDKEIFQKLTMGNAKNTFVTDRIELLLRSFKRYSLYTKDQCLEYLGSRFAIMLDAPDDMTALDVGLYFLKRVILVHLTDNKAKSDLLIHMTQKLYSLVAGDCCADNPDSPQLQEVLLPGHLYASIIKEKILDYLVSIKTQIKTDMRRQPHSVNFFDKKYLLKVLSKLSGAADVGKKLEYFLSTGNLISNTGLDLQQTSGYTIVAEKLNFYRYISHFRSIHRGSFFAELKTTTVRKLLPESWGFLCPVHTPDGSPCGLLNHLSHTCQIITHKVDVSNVAQFVASMGVHQMVGFGVQLSKEALLSETDGKVLSVLLDGQLIGYCSPEKAKEISNLLRYCKIEGKHNIPLELEIGLVSPSNGGQYPGLYLFSSFARMMRPVNHLLTGKTDLVGPFEQVYLDIACLDQDIVTGITTHQEVLPTNILSVVANLTPFSDYNQSPRNMYQCQVRFPKIIW